MILSCILVKSRDQHTTDSHRGFKFFEFFPFCPFQAHPTPDEVFTWIICTCGKGHGDSDLTWYVSVFNPARKLRKLGMVDTRRKGMGHWADREPPHKQPWMRGSRNMSSELNFSFVSIQSTYILFPGSNIAQWKILPVWDDLDRFSTDLPMAISISQTELGALSISSSWAASWQSKSSNHRMVLGVCSSCKWM